MKKKNKKILLGSIIAFLTLGVATSVGTLFNERNGWFDNLVNINKEDYNDLNFSNFEVADFSVDDNLCYGGFEITYGVIEPVNKSYEDIKFTKRLNVDFTTEFLYFQLKEDSIVDFYFGHHTDTDVVYRSLNITSLEGDYSKKIDGARFISKVSVELDSGLYCLSSSSAIDLYRILITTMEE